VQINGKIAYGGGANVQQGANTRQSFVKTTTESAFERAIIEQ
jgi:hypothetical protein